MQDSRWAQRVEIVASISVVVTLVLLVIEVRGNTKAVERQVLLDRASTVSAPFMEGPELLEAFKRVKEVDGWDAMHVEFMERYDMNPTQSVAWTFFLYKVWSGLRADFAYAGPSDKLASEIRSLLSYPDNQLYWKYFGLDHDPEFTAYVESVATEAAIGDREGEG